MYPRLLDLPRGLNSFIVGPRGCGKTTYLRKTYPDALFIDLLESANVLRYQARPDSLEQEILEQQASVVVLDEIQRVPGLLPTIHRLIEEYPTIRFKMTGSSIRKLRRKATDLLGGRAPMYHIGPLLAAEMQTDWDLQWALAIGTIPLVVSSEHPKDTLRGYLNVYIRQELMEEGLIRNLNAFSRFLEAASLTHGQLWNSSVIARESGVPRQTVDQYLEVLEELFLGFTLGCFSRRAKRMLIAHRRFYLIDAGLFRSIRPTGPLDSSSEIDGAALEGLVATHLLQWTQRSEGSHSLSFWRTRSGLEVDFVVYGPLSFVAIEVKHALSISDKDLKGLNAFLDDYPESHGVLLYRGKERRIKGRIQVLPVEDFLANVIPGQALL